MKEYLKQLYIKYINLGYSKVDAVRKAYADARLRQLTNILIN